MKLYSKKLKGFTLIELIIVIAIIGVLTALIMPNFMAGRIRARDAAKKSQLRSLKQALQLYYNDFQVYPGAPADPLPGTSQHYNNIPGCGALGTSNCSGSFEATSVYMKKLPSESYVFYSNNIDDTYVLRMTLENESDEDMTVSQSTCDSSCSGGSGCCTPSAGENYYCVCPD